jgi:hypothetical protein
MSNDADDTYARHVGFHAKPSTVRARHEYAAREGLSPSSAGNELLTDALQRRGYLKRAVRNEDGELF